MRPSSVWSSESTNCDSTRSPRLRPVLLGAASGAALAALLAVATTVSFDANAVAEPRCSGLPTIAPTAVGDIEGVVERFGEHRAQLTELVGNVVTLYRAAQGLPTFDRTRLLDRIEAGGVPYVWVRGNHDSATTQRAVAEQPNAVVLDGDAATVAGLRFWGVADTRYTPNKDQPTGREVERDQAEAFAPEVAELLADDEPPEVDAVLVHDARMAGEIGGDVPPPDIDRLVAYDRVTVRGLGETGARIERHVLDDPGEVRDE